MSDNSKEETNDSSIKAANAELNWEDGWRRFASYKNKHGNGSIPDDYVDQELVHWAKQQRVDYWKKKQDGVVFTGEEGLLMLERFKFDWGSNPFVLEDENEGSMSSAKQDEMVKTSIGPVPAIVSGSEPISKMKKKRVREDKLDKKKNKVSVSQDNTSSSVDIQAKDNSVVKKQKPKRKPEEDNDSKTSDKINTTVSRVACRSNRAKSFDESTVLNAAATKLSEDTEDLKNNISTTDSSPESKADMHCKVPQKDKGKTSDTKPSHVLMKRKTATSTKRTPALHQDSESEHMNDCDHLSINNDENNDIKAHENDSQSSMQSDLNHKSIASDRKSEALIDEGNEDELPALNPVTPKKRAPVRALVLPTKKVINKKDEKLGNASPSVDDKNDNQNNTSIHEPQKEESKRLSELDNGSASLIIAADSADCNVGADMSGMADCIAPIEPNQNSKSSVPDFDLLNLATIDDQLEHGGDKTNNTTDCDDEDDPNDDDDSVKAQRSSPRRSKRVKLESKLFITEVFPSSSATQTSSRPSRSCVNSSAARSSKSTELLKRKDTQCSQTPAPRKRRKQEGTRILKRVHSKDKEAILTEEVKKEFAHLLECDEPLSADASQGVNLQHVRHNQTFEDRFLEFLVFSKAYGHGYVPKIYKENPALGLWVVRMRAWKKKGDKRLTDSRLKRLIEAGFVWDPKGDPDYWRAQSTNKSAEEAWDCNFKMLLEFKKQNGDCLVPKDYPPNQRLARWVTKQRKNYKAKHEGNYNTLDDEKENRLKQVGFCFNTKTKAIMRATVLKRFEERWEMNCAKLVAFKKEYGHCAVPRRWKRDMQFASWVMRQRFQYRKQKEGSHSYLDPNRIKQLDDIGFVFGDIDRIKYPMPKGSSASSLKCRIKDSVLYESEEDEDLRGDEDCDDGEVSDASIEAAYIESLEDIAIKEGADAIKNSDEGQKCSSKNFLESILTGDDTEDKNTIDSDAQELPKNALSSEFVSLENGGVAGVMTTVDKVSTNHQPAIGVDVYDYELPKFDNSGNNDEVIDKETRFIQLGADSVIPDKSLPKPVSNDDDEEVADKASGTARLEADNDIHNDELPKVNRLDDEEVTDKVASSLHLEADKDVCDDDKSKSDTVNEGKIAVKFNPEETNAEDVAFSSALIETAVEKDDDFIVATDVHAGKENIKAVDFNTSDKLLAEDLANADDVVATVAIIDANSEEVDELEGDITDMGKHLPTRVSKEIWTCKNCQKKDFHSFVGAVAHEAVCFGLDMLTMKESMTLM